MLIKKRSVSFQVEPNIVSSGEDLWLGGTEAFWNEFQSEREVDTSIIEKFASKNHSYLDIGAWIGSTVLFGAQLAKKCYAFEPDPTAFSFLKRNLNCNPDILNVEAYQLAISNITGEIQLGAKTNKGDSMSSFLWKQDVWTSPSLSLEDCFNKHNITDCNFIKMDIEGGEIFALPAAKNVLKMYKPTLYLSLHNPWFSDKKDYFEKINDVLSIYKNIYNTDGQKISLQEIMELNEFTAIIATV